MKDCSYELILKNWNLDFKNLRSDLDITGSPERTVSRIVIQDINTDFFILEKIDIDQYRHKLMIDKTLEYLYRKGLKKIQPYLKNIYNEYISDIKGEYWQLKPYIQSNILKRPDYVFDRWRGEILAEFLLDLWGKSRKISFFNRNNPFDLRNYFFDMIKKMEIYNKKEFFKLKKCIKYIEGDFLNIYYDIPILFCHGDYHPLNIIWGVNDIRSVIDWEFLGYKSEIYDIANLLGCIGIEEPNCLINQLAVYFISRIKDSNIISDISFEYLIEFIITIRFAWLSEWFRKNDYEMINLEIDYINLLADKKVFIKKELNL
jgi:homoserine kinase type II